MTKFLNRPFLASGLSLLLTAMTSHADGIGLASETWAATDALGRVLPLAETTGAPKANRTVGIFYFLWHGGHGNRGPFDVSKILAADPDAMKKTDSPLWGPYGFPHYWGEPLFGYYRSDDAWVLRKHAQMLANAGVDTLIFDTTNAEIYRDTFMKLCDVFEQARRDAVRAPQICFMVNTKAGATARNIFESLYKPGLHRDLWFIWQGKPLMICDPQEADAELKNFFTLRKAHWPFEMKNTKGAWHWEATFPQPFGFDDDPNKPEQVNVSVAQNLRASDGKVTNMSDGNARGRGFHDGKMDVSPDAMSRGANFAEQWRRALELDPPFVMVTGWNEWIAGRFQPMKFVDQFDEQFSRDIEPMKGGHGDNFYYQLVAGIRRYKGCNAVAPVAPRPIAIDGNFDDWSGVAPEFRDPPGDVMHRETPGVGSTGVYTNKTGRNDIIAAKVSVDASNVYFYVRTAAKLSPSTDPNWMLLFIDADRDAKTGKRGYDVIVNCATAKNCAVGDHEIELAIQRAALGVAALPAEFYFKWADNLSPDGTAAGFTINGDAAPDDRFNYRARLVIAADHP